MSVYGAPLAWAESNPILAIVGVLIVAMTLWRLVVRGKWLIVLVMALGWTVVGLVAWALR